MSRRFWAIAIALLLTFAALFFPSIRIARAGTITVPDDYPTIQEAINAASDGDTVFVRNGTYYEHVIVTRAVKLIGENKVHTIIDGNLTGNVVTTQANGVVITGFTLRRSGVYRDWGVDLLSSGNNVSYNTIADNYAGIRLESSSGNLIVGNNISSNIVHGILSTYSSNNTISGNHIESQSNHAIWFDFSSNDNLVTCNNLTRSLFSGVIISGESKNNHVIGNAICGNFYGFEIFGNSMHNEIHENNIAYNNNSFRVEHSSENTIFHNDFIDNLNLFNQYVNSTNIWDNDYPSGGNYWSDYSGTDFYRGPYQNTTGSDGIGDAPYVISSSNQDKYPLMKPYPLSLHDIGIASVTTSKTGCLPVPTIGQGYNLSINLMVFNYGTSIEAFNMTICANSTVLTTMTNIILTSRNSTTLTFIWNTAGFAIGNYTMSAYAIPVLNETSIADNMFIDGEITITIPGDVDGNFVVNIFDVVRITAAYSVKEGDPRYDPNADLDNSGVINILDVVLCTGHYGKKYPARAYNWTVTAWGENYD